MEARNEKHPGCSSTDESVEGRLDETGARGDGDCGYCAGGMLSDGLTSDLPKAALARNHLTRPIVMQRRITSNSRVRQPYDSAALTATNSGLLRRTQQRK